MLNETDIGIDYLTDLTVLGRGGFSTVYSAMDNRFDRRVAVKVLRPFGSASERKMFQRECRAMGRLSSHQHVVTLYEAGFAADESPFMLMELVQGGSLDDLIERRGPIPWSEAVGYVSQAAAAIEHAHRSDVLHRDVKPANILLGEDGAKLTDFGISGLGVSGNTSSVNVAASWMHSPPETFPNKRDARSDIYSLGSTLYTLIVGTPPLWRDDGAGIEAIMYRVLHEVPPPIKAHLAPAQLRDFVARTLAKAPEDRPQTAAQFRAELNAVSNRAWDDTVNVGPTGFPEQPNAVPPGAAGGIETQTTSGRFKPVVLVAAAAALAMMIGGAVAMIQLLGETDEATGASITEEPDETTTTAASASTTTETSAATTTPTTAATTTTPTTESPAESSTTVTAVETTQAGAAAAPARFEDTIGSEAGATDALLAFLDENSQSVVELDLRLVLDNEDFIAADDTGGPTVVFRADGLSLRFLEESDGTSGVFFIRGNDYRVAGFFTVGELFGPNQGILTQALDPVAPEVVLSGG